MLWWHITSKQKLKTNIGIKIAYYIKVIISLIDQQFNRELVDFSFWLVIHDYRQQSKKNTTICKQAFVDMCKNYVSIAIRTLVPEHAMLTGDDHIADSSIQPSYHQHLSLTTSSMIAVMYPIIKETGKNNFFLKFGQTIFNFCLLLYVLLLLFIVSVLASNFNYSCTLFSYTRFFLHIWNVMLNNKYFIIWIL